MCPSNSICWNVPQILFVEIPIFISIAGSLLVDQSTSGVLVSVRGRGRGVTQIQFRPNSVGGCVGEKRNQQQVLSLFHRRPRFLFTRCKFCNFSSSSNHIYMIAYFHIFSSFSDATFGMRSWEMPYGQKGDEGLSEDDTTIARKWKDEWRDVISHISGWQGREIQGEKSHPG